MHTETIKVYLAAPWFTPKQKEVMDKVRNTILEFPIYNVFAPFYDGIVLTKENDSLEMRQKVFEMDVGEVAFRELIVVVVDDFDSGSIFEMGGAGILNWLYKKGYTLRAPNMEAVDIIPNIIAYSDVGGRGLNVMLQQCCWGFANGLEQLREQLTGFQHGMQSVDSLPFERGDFV